MSCEKVAGRELNSRPFAECSVYTGHWARGFIIYVFCILPTSLQGWCYDPILQRREVRLGEVTLPSSHSQYVTELGFYFLLDSKTTFHSLNCLSGDRRVKREEGRRLGTGEEV